MKQKTKMIVLPAAAFVVMFCIGTVLWGTGLVNKIGKINEEGIVYKAESFDVDTNKEDTIDLKDIAFAGDTVIKPSKNVINILLVGKDVKDGETDNGRTDSMILASLNRETGKASMVSFMRDCYVQIPGYSNNKLNAAYNIGGYSLLNKTLKQNFGIKVDYNIGVNFTSFTKVIDKLGGIDIELTADEAKYILKKTKKKTGLHKGMNHLDGKQALWYARTRYVSTGTESNDFGRTSRQRLVLQTVFKDIMKLPFTEILGIFDEIAGDLETDMELKDMVSLGSELYKMDLSSIKMHRIPDDNGYTDEVIRRMMVLVVDFGKAQANLKKWLY